MIETIPNSVDRQIKVSLSDRLASELDRIDIDWANDTTMMDYYLESMKRIWSGEVETR